MSFQRVIALMDDDAITGTKLKAHLSIRAAVVPLGACWKVQTSAIVIIVRGRTQMCL